MNPWLWYHLFCILFVVLPYFSCFREESIILWFLAIFHLYLYMSSIWICLICEYVLYLIMTPFIQPTIHHGWSESFNRKHYQDLKHWTMRHVVSSLIHSWEVSKHCHNWFLAVWLVDIIVKDLCYSTTPFSTHQKYSHTNLTRVSQFYKYIFNINYVHTYSSYTKSKSIKNHLQKNTI